MRKFKALFYFLILLSIAGCSRETLSKETRILMDTIAEISCYSRDREKALDAIGEAFKEMERIEKVFSKFNPESELFKVNNLAGSKEIAISGEVFRLLEDSIYYSKLSAGAFDVTVEPSKKGRYEKIILNKGKSSVYFSEPDMKIDFGGIAKGCAVDRAKDVLVSYGIKSALINIGGNIFALGNPPNRKAWQIGIRDPKNKSKIIYTLSLKNKAVSTSGGYERPSHIINPATGNPIEELLSVTIVANSAEEADALSTAVFVMGMENGLKLARSSIDIEAYIVGRDGNIISYP